jgi:hypothetical protein
MRRIRRHPDDTPEGRQGARGMTEAKLTRDEEIQSLLESNASLFKETERLKRRELRAYEERDEARAELEGWRKCYERADKEADDLNRAGLLLEVVKARRERDEARAKLDALQYEFDTDRNHIAVLEGTLPELRAALDEARAIARRLAVVARLALGEEVEGNMAHAYGSDVADDCHDILEAFDALPWATES